MSRKDNIKMLREAKHHKIDVFMIYKKTGTTEWGKLAAGWANSYRAFKMIAKKYDQIDVSLDNGY